MFTNVRNITGLSKDNFISNFLYVSKFHNTKHNSQRLQKLTDLHMSTECFMKIPLHSSGQFDFRNIY